MGSLIYGAACNARDWVPLLEYLLDVPEVVWSILGTLVYPYQMCVIGKPVICKEWKVHIIYFLFMFGIQFISVIPTVVRFWNWYTYNWKNKQ